MPQRTNAINIGRLSKYNFQYISIDEIVLMEYFFTCHLKKNIHLASPKRIEIEIGLKRSKITKATRDLIEKDFIVAKKGNIRAKYELKLETIISNANKLFSKPDKQGLQYLYYLLYSNGFKTKAVVRKNKREVKSRTKEAVFNNQISLF